MACTYDITTDRGKVRLIINDTASPIGCIFPDLEIDTFLSMNSNNINLAAAQALEAWMAKYALSPDSETIGDYSYTQKIIANMNKLRNELREKDSTTPIMDIASMDLTSGSAITEEED